MKKDDKLSQIKQAKRIFGLKKHSIAAILLVISSLFGSVFAMTVYAGAMSSSISEKVIVGTGTIFGTVLDQNGTGMESVKVEVLDVAAVKPVYTDSRGFFLIKNVPSGLHPIKLMKEGYGSKTFNIAVENDKTTVLEITLDNKNTEGNGGYFTSHIDDRTDTSKINKYLAYLLLASSLITLLSALAVFYHKYYHLSLLGSVFGLISIGYLFGSLCAIVAMGIILISKEEFD